MILGGTGAGKTTTLLDLILQAFNGCFHNVIIFCRNQDEFLYNYLLERAGKKKLEKSLHFIPVDNAKTDIPKPEQLLQEFEINYKDEQTLVCFDDLSNEKDQKNIIEYFIRGRKLNMSCCYLAHSFYDVPKKLRLQITHLFIKKLRSTGDLKMIIRDCSLGIDLNYLIHLYNQIVGNNEDKTKFFMIDLQTDKDKLKFRDCYNPVV